MQAALADGKYVPRGQAATNTNSIILSRERVWRIKERWIYCTIQTSVCLIHYSAFSAAMAM